MYESRGDEFRNSFLMPPTQHSMRLVTLDADAAGVFVIATSHDGRDGTTALDVVKLGAKGTRELVSKLIDDNKISGVISLISAQGTENDSLITGATANVMLGTAECLRVKNFVTIGPDAVLVAKAKKDPKISPFVNGKVSVLASCEE